MPLSSFGIRTSTLYHPLHQELSPQEILSQLPSQINYISDDLPLQPQSLIALRNLLNFKVDVDDGVTSWLSTCLRLNQEARTSLSQIELINQYKAKTDKEAIRQGRNMRRELDTILGTKAMYDESIKQAAEAIVEESLKNCRNVYSANYSADAPDTLTMQSTSDRFVARTLATYHTLKAILSENWPTVDMTDPKAAKLGERPRLMEIGKGPNRTTTNG